MRPWLWSWNLLGFHQQQHYTRDWTQVQSKMCIQSYDEALIVRTTTPRSTTTNPCLVAQFLLNRRLVSKRNARDDPQQPLPPSRKVPCRLTWLTICKPGYLHIPDACVVFSYHIFPRRQIPMLDKPTTTLYDAITANAMRHLFQKPMSAISIRGVIRSIKVFVARDTRVYIRRTVGNILARSRASSLTLGLHLPTALGVYGQQIPHPPRPLPPVSDDEGRSRQRMCLVRRDTCYIARKATWLLGITHCRDPLGLPRRTCVCTVSSVAGVHHWS